uniref:CD34 molecule n=1 Tax=Chelydra serpentina TaxID=8475 RepID=A0A8C3S825_CHESE
MVSLGDESSRVCVCVYTVCVCVCVCVCIAILGIKSYELESIGRHQKTLPRKTLIALVTSGLLLAFLSLAGYFLMKRRSWSPRGERLDEDLCYTENGSQGNTVITVASQEQSEQQEKPNLNRGAQKNGTGQASSKNGHSARQHIVADTEL